MPPATSAARTTAYPAILIAALAMAAAAAVLVLNDASIYGDGSWYLVSLIHLGHPRPIAGREFVNYLKELPAWLGLGVGSTSTRTLTLLQSLGFIVEPLIGWCAALWIARRSSLLLSLVLLAAASGYATCMIFSVNELNLTLALLVLVMVALADEQPWGGARTVICLICVVVLVWAYEFMVAWGPLLVWYALLRRRAWRQAGNDRMVRNTGAVAGLGIAAILMAIYTLLFHTSPNTEGFGSGLVGKPYTSGTQVIGACLLVAGAVLIGARRSGIDGDGDVGGGGRVDRVSLPPPDWGGWMGLIVAIALALLAVHYVLLAGNPGVAYTARSWPAVFVLALQLVLIACVMFPPVGRVFRSAGRRLLVPALVFCVLSMISPIAFGFGFHNFVESVQRTIDTHPGQTIKSARAVPPGQQKYLWTWANQSLSLLLRAGPGSGIVDNDQVKGGWLPFPESAVHRQLSGSYRW